jgi:acyl carrier protein|tara:strand:- start:605 stop:832 length:228 start_codon:yes stop_codon:yes gene_type:complete
MIEKKIIEILNSIIKNNIDLRKNKKLVTDGHLDSFSVLLLISKIEQTFKIKIKLEKFDINYFNSVASIKKLVSKK